MKLEIQRFLEDKEKSLAIEELADALYSPERTTALFLEHLHTKGIVGNPLAMEEKEWGEEQKPPPPIVTEVGDLKRHRKNELVTPNHAVYWYHNSEEI